jgi:hypothetical protein
MSLCLKKQVAILSSMADKKIGIITGKTSLFSSGLIQNALFIYDVLTRRGHSSELFAYAPKTRLEYKDVLVNEITTDEDDFDYKQFKMIIAVGNGITKGMYERCKRNNVRVIGFVCGNILMMHIEEFVSPTSSSTVVTKSQPVDEIWVIQSFSFMKTYLELLRGAPVKCVPHLWSPCLLKNAAVNKFKEPESNLYFKPKSGKRINILIMEPNVDFVKSALIPIMAAEKLYLENPDLIDEVYVFNFPEKNDAASGIVNSLSVRSKMRIFKSQHIATVLLHFNALDSLPVFVSHQMYTPWNYLYYELMHFGYPLVHNSDYFKDSCYFYPEVDIDLCYKKILEASASHNSVYEAQKLKNSLYLNTIDPENKECAEYWNNLVISRFY